MQVKLHVAMSLRCRTRYRSDSILLRMIKCAIAGGRLRSSQPLSPPGHFAPLPYTDMANAGSGCESRRLSKKEIIRCLKRYIARELYKVLTHPKTHMTLTKDLAKTA
ncbi:hypothetical protein [Acrocarpospora sp. B8E8]|uniref:hypothetical protein n=1 Tax=Acrocarpospora sp. B8E8 TaxID=3153572 RepID=UPI00325FD27C